MPGVRRVVLLTLGWEELPKSISVHGAPSDITLREPVPGILLDTDAGWLLLDTGFNTALIRDPYLHARYHDREGYRAVLPGPGEPIEEALDKAGIPFDGITAVAVSHLHLDHAGGLKLFAGKVPVHAQRTELEYGLSGSPDVEQHAIYRVDFDDPRIDWCLADGESRSRPGSPPSRRPATRKGHQSFVVELDESVGGGGFVFAFDAADLTENIEHELAIGGFIDVEPEETVEPIRRLKKIAADKGYRLGAGPRPARVAGAHPAARGALRTGPPQVSTAVLDHVLRARRAVDHGAVRAGGVGRRGGRHDSRRRRIDADAACRRGDLDPARRRADAGTGRQPCSHQRARHGLGGLRRRDGSGLRRGHDDRRRHATGQRPGDRDGPALERKRAAAEGTLPRRHRLLGRRRPRQPHHLRRPCGRRRARVQVLPVRIRATRSSRRWTPTNCAPRCRLSHNSIRSLLVHAESASGARTSARRRPAAATPSSCPRGPTARSTMPCAVVVDAVAATGARAHIVHVSSAAVLPMIAAAKRAGLPVTAETCPHYLTFAAEDVPDGGTSVRLLPADPGPGEQRAPVGGAGRRHAGHGGLRPLAVRAAAQGPRRRRLRPRPSAASARCRWRCPPCGPRPEPGFGLSDVCRWMAARPGAAGRPDRPRGDRGRPAGGLLRPRPGRELGGPRRRPAAPAAPAPRMTGMTLTGGVLQTWLRGRVADEHTAGGC